MSEHEELDDLIRRRWTELGWKPPHRWDYEFPSNTWEEMRWFVRWPLLMGTLVLFGVLLSLPFVAPWWPR